jgi:hypothetical protein
MNQKMKKVHRVAVRGIQMHPCAGRAGLSGEFCRQGRFSLGRLTGDQDHAGGPRTGGPLDQPRTGNGPGKVRQGDFGNGSLVSHGVSVQQLGRRAD